MTGQRANGLPGDSQSFIEFLPNQCPDQVSRVCPSLFQRHVERANCRELMSSSASSFQGLNSKLVYADFGVGINFRF
jgi:hypothetical protein